CRQQRLGGKIMNVGFKSPVRLDAEHAERGFDLRTYVNFVWRNWMFIAAVVVLALLVGVVYLIRAIPTYTSTAQILLDPQRERGTSAGGELVNSKAYDSATLENQLSIITSDQLLRRVVIKEQLVPPADTSSSEMDKAVEEQRVQNAINRLRGALRARRIG